MLFFVQNKTLWVALDEYSSKNALWLDSLKGCNDKCILFLIRKKKKIVVHHEKYPAINKIDPSIHNMFQNWPRTGMHHQREEVYGRRTDNVVYFDEVAHDSLPIHGCVKAWSLSRSTTFALTMPKARPRNCLRCCFIVLLTRFILRETGCKCALLCTRQLLLTSFLRLLFVPSQYNHTCHGVLCCFLLYYCLSKPGNTSALWWLSR